MKMKRSRNDFMDNDIARGLLIANGVLAIIYFIVIAFFFPYENGLLFGALILGEVFHVWQTYTYLHAVWDMDEVKRPDVFPAYMPTADIFITTAGEPIDIIEETLEACIKMDYPNKSIYLLNDGFVAGKDNWREVEKLAETHDVTCITRKTPGGAKAGNINNALKQSEGEMVVIFDADHVPHEDFLEKTIPYLSDEKVGFVQTPQYYKNHELNYVTQGAWQQQELFFGAICKGKNRYNAATMCGTNMVMRREALAQVGGMCEESIAEDFATGMFMHGKGWKSIYVSEILAEGLAPEDFLSYYKQQYRWARGALDVIFSYNVLFYPGLTIQQRIQYLGSASFYLSGIVVVIDALLPIIFFFTGIAVISVSTMLLALVFIPYIVMTLYVIQRSSNNSLTFQSLGFSMGAFGIHLQALWSAIIRQKASFSITSKRAVSGNFIYLAAPHIGYGLLAITGITYAIVSYGANASVINNAAWAIFNFTLFVPFIYAASPLGSRVKERSKITTENVAMPPLKKPAYAIPKE